MSLPLRAAARLTSPTPSPTSNPRGTTPSPTPAPFVWPADGWFVQAMTAGHPAGIDIGLDMGARVQAVRDGTVVFAGGDPCCVYGYFVIILHDEGWSSLYAHLSAIDVWPGDRVSQGERIGLAGSTGKSTGPHVHFELRSASGLVDPLAYLPPRQGFAAGLAAYAQPSQPYAAPESYAAPEPAAPTAAPTPQPTVQRAATQSSAFAQADAISAAMATMSGALPPGFAVDGGSCAATATSAAQWLVSCGASVPGCDDDSACVTTIGVCVIAVPLTVWRC